jgi:hypothetical protein
LIIDMGTIVGLIKLNLNIYSLLGLLHLYPYEI